MATTTVSNVSDVVSFVTQSTTVGQSTLLGVLNNGTDNSATSSPLTIGNMTGILTNHTTRNWSDFNPTDDESFSEAMSPKDETLFVALIIMGVIVPAIFIFSFFMIFWRRYKQQQQRRAQMLLQNAQDVPMDTIPYRMQARLEAGIL
ncbi:uncharacterized protein LOC132565130 [Ylistrum balloti]|uniref:uncharacterized protein LOC132565130 n=1 Tax=Ylistrum balloti TaxID=509963 RepID=UPI002905F641|nr:uncharacterized protein LOC132565130 [Ylistrum balloti]XP_060085724.1 uncharacterized protein LOC132565130 [Ylistrum balloti]XP_060085725.1 uncharacterized protein LOC132565130 [Ylistrum balloti]